MGVGGNLQIILIQFISKLGYCKVVLVTECQSAVCSSRLLVGCHLLLQLPLLPLAPCWGKVDVRGFGKQWGKKINPTLSFLQASAVCF